MYMVTLVRTQKGVLYKWRRQKCTGYIGTHTEGCCTNGAGGSVQVTLVRTQRDAVQMEQAEVYRLHRYAHRGVLYKWSRRKCTGLVHGHGNRRTEKQTRRTVKSRAVPRLFLVFQTGQS